MAVDTPRRGFQAGIVVAGRYAVLEPIGAGGMGTVFRARHVELDREVALKVIGQGGVAGDDEAARFTREARLLARLSHAAIVTVHDFGRSDDGTWYLVQELVRGEDLVDRLRTRGAMSWTDALDVAIRIAEALAYAHAQGVLHRDLKPSNIMLAAGSSSPVKVIDFGLARLHDAAGAPGAATASAYVVGTPGYIAPEYAWAGVAGPAVDHYALGVVLYEMLTAQHPFDAAPSLHARFAKEQLDALAPAVPAALRECALALIEAEPARRPQDPLRVLQRIRAAHAAGSIDRVAPLGKDTPNERRPPRATPTSRPMVRVEAGVVRLALGGGRAVDVRVPTFFIDKHPVTCGDWLRFVEATGARAPAAWVDGRPARGELAVPKVDVTFDEASAYAAWAGRRLPTEAEWELAARGEGALLHPWGDVWQTGLCHPVHEAPFERRRPEPIGVFSPQGDSAAGVADLLQIWEWVQAPYQSVGALVRGGPWRDRCEPASLHNRSWEDEAARDVGFRCARDA